MWLGVMSALTVAHAADPVTWQVRGTRVEEVRAGVARLVVDVEPGLERWSTRPLTARIAQVPELEALILAPDASWRVVVEVVRVLHGRLGDWRPGTRRPEVQLWLAPDGRMLLRPRPDAIPLPGPPPHAWEKNTWSELVEAPLREEPGRPVLEILPDGHRVLATLDEVRPCSPPKEEATGATIVEIRASGAESWATIWGGVSAFRKVQPDVAITIGPTVEELAAWCAAR